jgi:hypothetical protein
MERRRRSQDSAPQGPKRDAVEIDLAQALASFLRENASIIPAARQVFQVVRQAPNDEEALEALANAVKAQIRKNPSLKPIFERMFHIVDAALGL